MLSRPRVIQAPPLGGYPSHVVCLACAVARTFQGEADECGVQHLAKFAAVILHDVGDGYTVVKSWSGANPQTLWKRIDQLANTARSVWIMAPYAREHACITGLWDRIEDGQCIVRARNAGEGKGHVRQGFVCLAAPPTIVNFTLAGHDTPFTLLDPENYGAELPISDECWKRPNLCSSACTLVASWWASWAGACRKLGFTGLAYTAGGTAHNHWLRQPDRPAITLHDAELVTRWEREALYSGRVECRFLGRVRMHHDDKLPFEAEDAQVRPIRWQGPLYHLDVNSLYPSVAVNAVLPTKLAGVQPFADAATALSLAKTNPILALVRVTTDTPCVPCRLKIERRAFGSQAANERYQDESGQVQAVIYPIGDFWTWLYGPEIVLAAEWGKIKDVRNLVWYEGANLYGEWVSQLWAARRAACESENRSLADCIKALLNSAFGKWAQHAARWDDRPNALHHRPYSQWTQIDRDSGLQVEWRSLAWMVQERIELGEHADAFPAVFGMITSLGRVRLWRLLQTAGLEHVFYYDTDSLWVTRPGWTRLKDAGEGSAEQIGKLKLVDGHSDVCFYGNRQYMADGELTCAGYDGVVIENSEATATVRKAKPLGAYLWAKRAPGIDRIDASVMLGGAYLHGIPQADGTVLPHRLNDQAMPVTLDIGEQTATF
jgi:hypothetical protein